MQLGDIDNAIAQDPTNATYYWLRGRALLTANNLLSAQKSFEAALELLPRYAEAWVGVGEIHVLTGNRWLARSAFRTALEIDSLTPDAVIGYFANAGAFELLLWKTNISVRNWLRRLRRRRGCPGAIDALRQAEHLSKRKHTAAAIDVLRRALDRCPGHLEIAKLLAALLYRHGDPRHGRRLLERMVRLWPNDPQSHYALGVCLTTTGELKAGIEALEKALELKPDDHDIRVCLSAAGKLPPPQPASDVIRKGFDRYSEKFDAHLVKQLNYRIPEKLAEVFAARGRIYDRMLDLGCGTGLCGINLRSYARHLVGVDFSERMIQKARERNVYDDLYEQECVAFLQEIKSTFDIVIAADVLIYIGDLSELFQAIRSRLTSNGEFWFSTEECEGNAFKVTFAQRYQHSTPYIRATADAAGLQLTYEQAVEIRLDGGNPVPGRLLALQRLR